MHSDFSIMSFQVKAQYNIPLTIKQLLDEVFVICGIINVEVRVISRAEVEADNSYRDIDTTNTAYCNNLHRRLNITELSADCVIVTFICIQLTDHNA